MTAKKAKSKAVKKSAGGRPTSYRAEYVEDAHAQCLLGATDEELAAHFGISCATLYEWKKRYPEFSEAIKRGKRPADKEIAHALFQRARGAEWVEEQAIKCRTVTYKDGKRVREEERVEVVEVTRRAPPDTTAGIFWLKNRQPQHWRDRQDVDVTTGGKPLPPTNITVALVRPAPERIPEIREAEYRILPTTTTSTEDEP